MAGDHDRSRSRWAQRRLPSFPYPSSDHAFFVTICAARGMRPFTRHELAEDVIASLHWLREQRDVRLYAFCLMPNHVHLLLSLPEGSKPLGEVLGAFKTFTTKKAWKYGIKGELWQQRFYDHILRRSEDGRAVGAYILANPVRKGLAERPEEYPYSGCPDEW